MPPNYWYLCTRMNDVTYIDIQLMLVRLIPLLRSVTPLYGRKQQTAECLIFLADFDGLYKGPRG
jgi:hypothetical protein